MKTPEQWAEEWLARSWRDDRMPEVMPKLVADLVRSVRAEMLLPEVARLIAEALAKSVDEMVAEHVRETDRRAVEGDAQHGPPPKGLRATGEPDLPPCPTCGATYRCRHRATWEPRSEPWVPRSET